MSEPPVSEVSFIRCFMPSNEYIRALSVLEVNVPEDLMSPLLGVTNLEQACSTCDSYLESCCGHSGHLDLKIPTYRVFWLKRLITFLNCQCFYCGSVRLPRSDPHYLWISSLEAKYRLHYIYKYTRAYKRCWNPKCALLYPSFKSEDRLLPFITALVPLEADSEAVTISPTDLYYCAKYTSEETKSFMGFDENNDPSSLFWEVLPVPSLNTRPCHTFAGIGDKKKNKSDWLVILSQIVKARNTLIETMQNYPNDTINIANYSYKSVVSKDPDVCRGAAGLDKHDLAEFKVEQKEKHATRKKEFSKVELAYREMAKIIAGFHSHKHRSFVKSFYGKQLLGVEDRYQGQKSARLRGNVTSRRVNSSLRCVLAGSIDLLPTQIGVPEKSALDLTFPEHVTRFNIKRLHDAILTGPYQYPGANYVMLKTGQEIDLQHIENRRTIRMEEVLYVKRHLINGDVGLVNRQPTLHRNSQMALKVKITPNLHVASMHHSLLAGFGADFDGDEINIHVLQTIEAAAEALLLCSPETSIMKDGKVWINFIQNAIVGAYHMTLPSSRIRHRAMVRIVNQIERLWSFPPCDGRDAEGDFWLGKTLISLILPEDFCLKTSRFEIARGRMVSGTLNADGLNGPNGIIATMCRDYSDKSIALQFIHEGYLLFQAYIDGVGLSVGYFDCAVDPRDKNVHVDRINYVRNVHVPTLERLIDIRFSTHNPHSGDGDTEQCILKHIEFVTKAMTDATANYHAAKSHGQNGLLTMIDSGAKGNFSTLNAMSGAVCSIFLSSKRMEGRSSHYPQGQTWSLQSAGFIAENYSTGISLLNVLTESHPSGESVVSKNKGTSKSGYIVRKLASCMMGIVVDWTKRVVDTNGRILWEHYGDDDYDSMCLATIPVPKEAKYKAKALRLPLRLEHVLYCAKQLCQASSSLSSLSLTTYATHVWDTLVDKGLVLETHADMYFALHWWLSEDSLCKVFGTTPITSRHLEWILDEIQSILQRALITPGESVGVRAVQDAGEPYVQLCLKTPHLSGKFGKMTADTARFAEIVDSNFHHTSMTIVLKRSLVATKIEAIQFGLSISRCFLSDIGSAFPTIMNNVVTFPIDRAKAIYRMISLRKAAQRISMETNIPLTRITTSFADEPVYWIQIDVKDITSLCPPQALIHNLYNRVLINGIAEIETFILESPEAPFTLTTLGSNLKEILTYKQVNAKKTMTNDCSEMGAVLGLHAARRSLEHELLRIMAGTTDDRHIKLIARKMVADLELKGMKIKQGGQSIPPLMRACYEEGPKQMAVYCAQAERDFGSTVASAALANNLLRVGTGFSADYIIKESNEKALLPKMVEYVASPKVDGTCMQLTFKDKMAALTTRDFRVWYVPINGLFFDAIFAGTSLTGDMVETAKGPLFVVYDCEACCGNSLERLRYDHRLEIAREVVYRLITCNLSICFDKARDLRLVPMGADKGSIPIALRRQVSEWAAVPGEFFFAMCVKPVFEPKIIARILPYFSLPMDGVVYTSLTHPITPFRTNREAILKWKPVHSIDVTLKIDTPGFYSMWSADHRRVGTLASDNSVREGQCYECEMVKGAWRVMRTRQKAANTFETIQAIMPMIEHPMTLNDIRAKLY